MVRKKDPEFTLDRDDFNTLEEGIIAINTQAEVIYINRSAAEMLNTTEGGGNWAAAVRCLSGI